MKKTIDLDPKLLREAKEATGARTTAEAVRLGLEAAVRHAAYQRMRTFLGTETYSPDVPRRREKPARKRRVA